MEKSNLNPLSFEFFREFFRYEYRLKVAGLRNEKAIRAATA